MKRNKPSCPMGLCVKHISVGWHVMFFQILNFSMIIFFVVAIYLLFKKKPNLHKSEHISIVKYICNNVLKGGKYWLRKT